MKVIRASKAGFCMGVGLALKKLESALDENKAGKNACSRICTLGPIIHNPQVLASFQSRGAHCLNSLDEILEADCVLIRAHGIPRDVEAELRTKCAKVVDATCPKVKNAQMAIRKATSNGADLLLFGESDHPEVAGLVSYANNAARVFESLEELEVAPPAAEKPYVLASQTTQDREIFNQIATRLAIKLKKLEVLSTICDATRERQQEALNLARKVDVMVIAGGRNSGNTRRLASIAKQAGIDAWHIETVSELVPGNFEKKSIAGLTAGASTPKSLIDEVEEWLLQL